MVPEKREEEEEKSVNLTKNLRKKKQGNTLLEEAKAWQQAIKSLPYCVFLCCYSFFPAVNHSNFVVDF